VAYNQNQLLQILNQPVQGNCLVSVAHQLIAAKLNIANDAPHDCIDQTISEVDALIGDLVVPPIGDGFLACNISGYIEALTAYNEGTSECAVHCDDSLQDPQPFIRDNPCVR
jgi:hypothetical protein